MKKRIDTMTQTETTVLPKPALLTHQSSGNWTRPIAYCVGICVLTLVGCANPAGILGVDQHADIPAGSLPSPLGRFSCDWQTAQATAAANDRRVFYRADFVGNTAEIAPAALRQFVERLQAADATATMESVLEPSGNPELDQTRSQAIAATAIKAGFTGQVPVYLGHSPALGLLGGEGERLGRASGAVGNRRGNTNSSGLGNAGNSGGGFGRSSSSIRGGF